MRPHRVHRWLTRALTVLWLTGAAVGLVPAADAGQERYDYDALGRLIRVIDEQGRVTEYVYDAAGNLLQVITGGTAQAPTVTAITPTSIRRGETKQIQVTGSDLTGTTVTVADAGLRLSNVSTTASQVTFTLTALTTATLGSQTFTFSKAAGSATATITVNPELPKMFVSPAPLAILPDGVARQFTVRLSNADTIDNTIGLTVKDTTVATVSPASLTIPAGQTEAQASITGLKVGQTALTLTSVTLGTTSVPIFVTTEVRGLNTSVSALLGVVKEQSATSAPPTTVSPVISASLGVVLGNYIKGLNPNALSVGTGPTPVVISGAGLGAAASVTVVPPDGITVGALTVSTDGQSLTVPITVGATAPRTLCQVVVATASGVLFTAAAPSADRLLITFPPPEITSIDPLFAVPGSSVPFTVRGRNLQSTLSVNFSPSTGITAGSSPTISADGTQLTTTLAVALTAPLGVRTVTVATPGGTSDATPTAANTFTIVNEIQNSVTPIVSAILGVIKETTTTPPSQSQSLFSSALGVSLGSVATSLTPAAKAIGESFTLTVQGFELQGVTAVQFSPNTGVTIGAPTVGADGRSLTVPVTLASDAPQTLRTVRVLAGTASISFSDPAGALFRVTAPPARLDSISPIVLQIGAPLTPLTVRGANFQNASQVKIVPPDGMTVSSLPSVSTDGTTLNVNISAAVGTAPGPRAVVVVTPAGETSTTLTEANTLTLSTSAGTTFTPVTSPLLGVVKETPPAPPTSTVIGPIEAPLVGVVVEFTQPPTSTTNFLASSALGVALGAVPTRIDPTGIVRGSAGTLTVNGTGLGGVTGVSVIPPDGITLGTLTISPDGSQVSVPITVAADAPVVTREVVVTTASGRLAFSDPQANRLRIGAGVPRMDSITPILANQGQKLTLTVRGANFQGVTAVTATPPDGITFSSTLTVDTAGTIITIDMVIAPDAPPTSRVIQVVVPGAISRSDAVPANTFTVFPP